MLANPPRIAELKCPSAGTARLIRSPGMHPPPRGLWRAGDLLQLHAGVRLDLHHPGPPDGRRRHHPRLQVREANRIDVSQGIALPGWDASYQPQELKCLLAAYNSLGEENLWRNLTCWQFHPVAGRALRAGGRRLLGLLGSDFWNIVPKKLETVWPLDV